MKVEHILNHEIKLPQVSILTMEGEKIGTYSLKDALSLADKEGLDLMQLGENQNIAICKMVDYESWLYRETKKKQKLDFKNRSQDLKSINFRPAISTNDFNLKIKKINDFLSNKHKVKVVIKLRSREGSMKDINNAFVDKIMEGINNFGTLDGSVSFTGRDIIFTVKPEKATNEKK